MFIVFVILLVVCCVVVGCYCDFFVWQCEGEVFVVDFFGYFGFGVLVLFVGGDEFQMIFCFVDDVIFVVWVYFVLCQVWFECGQGFFDELCECCVYGFVVWFDDNCKLLCWKQSVVIWFVFFLVLLVFNFGVGFYFGELLLVVWVLFSILVFILLMIYWFIFFFSCLFVFWLYCCLQCVVSLLEVY